MSWNWAYSKRKQKEMAAKSASYQRENDSYKYTEFNKPKNTTAWQEEKARERRRHLIAVTLLTLYSMFFIGVITYFLVYGV